MLNFDLILNKILMSLEILDQLVSLGALQVIG